LLQVGGLVGRAELLRALPGDVDFVVPLVDLERLVEPGLLLVGEPLGTTGAQLTFTNSRKTLTQTLC